MAVMVTLLVVMVGEAAVVLSMSASQARAAIEWRLIVGEMRGARRKSRFGNSRDGWRRRVEGYGGGRGDGDDGWGWLGGGLSEWVGGRLTAAGLFVRFGSGVYMGHALVIDCHELSLESNFMKLTFMNCMIA